MTTVNELARFLLSQPTAVARLLDQHVDDGTGHCRTCCSGDQRGFLAWPCALYEAATLASTAHAKRPA